MKTLIAALGTVALVLTAPFAMAADKPTDPQIAHIAYSAGVIDIEAAKLALSKTENPEIKAFAESMQKDHEAVNEMAMALVKKLKVTPQDNAISQSLLKGEKETLAKLRKLSGAAFAKAYIDNEVAYHEAVIAAVKNILIPQAENEELKKTLISVLPLLEHHLEMARMEQAKIK